MTRRFTVSASIALALLFGAALTPLHAEDKKDPAPAASDDGKSKPDPAEAAAAAHTAWLGKTIDKIQNGQVSERAAALKELIEKDKDGNCIKPLAEKLKDMKPEAIQIEVIRGLGRKDLVAASSAIEAFLGSKSDALRANAAVSLEYIGNPKSVKPLLKQMKKEKDILIQNHIARAVGRCGVKDESARKALSKEAIGGKTEAEGLGAIIGLAYFEGNTKVARDLEKLMKKVGVPSFGGRGGGRGQNMMRRAYLGWALGQVGDAKTTKFIDKHMLDPLENVKSPMVEAVKTFYFDVSTACQGDEAAKGRLKTAVTTVRRFAPDVKLQDDARRDRDMKDFEPKAEWNESDADLPVR